MPQRTFPLCHRHYYYYYYYYYFVLLAVARLGGGLVAEGTRAAVDMSLAQYEMDETAERRAASSEKAKSKSDTALEGALAASARLRELKNGCNKRAREAEKNYLGEWRELNEWIAQVNEQRPAGNDLPAWPAM